MNTWIVVGFLWLSGDYKSNRQWTMMADTCAPTIWEQEQFCWKIMRGEHFAATRELTFFTVEKSEGKYRFKEAECVGGVTTGPEGWRVVPKGQAPDYAKEKQDEPDSLSPAFRWLRRCPTWARYLVLIPGIFICALAFPFLIYDIAKESK